MDPKRFESWFRKDAVATYWLIVIFVGSIWIATLLDYVLNLKWGCDPRALWIAPLILCGATAIRFFHTEVDRLLNRTSDEV